MGTGASVAAAPERRIHRLSRRKRFASIARQLTVKLRGRAPRPDKRRRRILSFSAGGAKPPTPHGPLERLLGDVIGVCPACCLDHI